MHPKQRAKRAEAASRATPPDAAQQQQQQQQHHSKRLRLDEATGQTSGGGATLNGGALGCGSSAFRVSICIMLNLLLQKVLDQQWCPASCILLDTRQ